MIKYYRPTSPGRRDQTRAVGKSHKDSIIKTPKGLLKTVKQASGRSHGRISVQHRRVGAKKQYRIIDFKRNNYDVKGRVISIDYDPYRTCEIALISYKNGDKRYILASSKLSIGDVVVSGENVPIKEGNALPMNKMPVGTIIHNIELYPKAGGKFIRGAGSSATLTASDGKYVHVKMPSGEVRKFLASCYATIGQVGNSDWKLMKLGKAGRSYHLGVRPTNRGIARSDGHPHGGSYSRRVGRQPVDKWGNLSKGKKTRKRKHTNKYIVTDRRKGR